MLLQRRREQQSRISNDLTKANSDCKIQLFIVNEQLEAFEGKINVNVC